MVFKIVGRIFEEKTNNKVPDSLFENTWSKIFSTGPFLKSLWGGIGLESSLDSKI